ncbi:hypothetical protein pEaSNUABM14_00271 [Erwinia phage pEa_SNUABM_14]|uniref:Uncharacterized protein n=1 Tax=Erwinia phage pEa_SNUABM_7 TaxID=2866695 RepID=A0AAE7WTK4_9CAUD|nr:hypothetical protein MPK74_gp272 [Erwinia phage pEa_SNUABM_7]QYW03230.1 hypothetical protein pEaSNUABM13_00271 [Erwinia phage pEa_SNUABM_13]QYW03571.1 hypothetical protein pEaSNUABM34_00269 [Erwinia phage pEa_SNUABM_34]QYW03912.1 hypothetical protein pEaSNUABM45_00269 [Erwinia phage pEa_SNUABM_45]QYW04253.1 hypothetical protein pEaSNUABM46_00269 [Erwinia phage pEa_SNUABM_46]QYW04596.1 hypothetical protein pEaSNUABM14_00271 [Erwinia phage pEa_SNUABM_14]QYW05283.1 hypothetical protein pEaSNU
MKTTDVVHIAHHLMTHLASARLISALTFIGQDAVRFKVGSQTFDVRGRHPSFIVHQVEGGCLCADADSAEIEAQLNGDPISSMRDQLPHPENVQSAIIDHVNSMPDKDVQNFSEHQGGPDMDTMFEQRLWLKNWLISRSIVLADMLDIVAFLEGTERRNSLAMAIELNKGKRA